MIVGFVKEFHATSLSQLPERINKIGIPTLTLLNKQARDAVGYLELLPLTFKVINLLKDSAVSWEVAFSRCSLKHFPVQGIVKVQVEEVFFRHLRSRQQICMKASTQTQRLMNLKYEANIWQGESFQLGHLFRWRNLLYFCFHYLLVVNLASIKCTILYSQYSDFALTRRPCAVNVAGASAVRAGKLRELAWSKFLDKKGFLMLS